jgi:N-acetylgalactosamine-N,N'-diacetylbacillosaminyl-diphospho-undecaprenol 4-alpha-N-acetylgalactosaminyltransferase
MAQRSAARRPRILFVINSLAGGGAERVMLKLIESSRARLDGAEFALALLDDEPRAYAPPDWLTVHQLDGRFKLGRSVRELAGVIRTFRPDVTLSFLTRSNMATVILSHRYGFSSVISERANTSGHFKPGLSGRVAKALIRLLYPRASHVVAPSQGIADDLAEAFGVSRTRLSVIANPIDAPRIRELAQAPVEPPFPGRYAVVVSRLTAHKNVELVIEALARAPSDLSLAVLGQGPELARLEALTEALGLRERVRFLGFVANPYAMMQSADFYVSASNGEGFPNGLVEALALGLPVVATNCPSGPSEILADAPREAINGVHEGAYGVLVPQNDVASMVDAFERIQRPAVSARYRAAAPGRADAYGVDAARDAFWRVMGQFTPEMTDPG